MLAAHWGAQALWLGSIGSTRWRAVGRGKPSETVICRTLLAGFMTTVQLTYNATATDTEGNLYDTIRDQSMILAKNHGYTTNDGHLMGVLCDITVTADPDAYVSLFFGNNTWKLRNSVRKFHFLRNHMFRESGVKKSEMGTYGKTLRPYFDARHAAPTSPSIPEQPIYAYYRSADDSLVTRAMTGGEWTYSQYATVPAYEEQAGPEGVLPEVNEWPAHLFDESVVDLTSDGAAAGTTAAVTWTSVGMIHAYNLDRQSVQVQTADTTLDGPNNPLAALSGAGNQATGAVVEISEDQELELPPYDLDDAGDSIHFTQGALRKLPSTGGSVTFRNVFLPAGYMRMMAFTQAGDGSLTMVQQKVEIDVLANIECRDLA